MPELKIDLSYLTDEQKRSLSTIRDIQHRYGHNLSMIYNNALMLRCGVTGNVLPLSDFVYDGRIYIKDGQPVCKEAMNVEYMHVDDLINAYMSQL